MNIKRLLRKFRKNKPAYSSGWADSGEVHLAWSSDSKKTTDKRIEKKPAEVFKEILCKEPKFNLNNLNAQIKMVKDRKNVLRDHLGSSTLKDEEIALNFLKARKKYLKNKDLFKWGIATEETVAKLTKKYKLKVSSLSSYYKTVPLEGVEEIAKFAKAFDKVSNADISFRIIVDDGGKEDKKDPILLAESPFGRWYYVLGAWDKEVEIVDELLYKKVK